MKIKNKKIGSAVVLTGILVGLLGAASVSAQNLSVGSRGESVSELQAYLQERDFLTIPRGVAPGYFGNLTRAAVRKFQASAGITQTGVYDDDTKMKLTGQDKTKKDGGESMPRTDTKAAGLRVLLNSINREHANLAAIALRNGYDGAVDFDASFKALDNNSVEIGNSVASVYGEAAGAQFLEIWRSHITFFKNYTVASKTGDQAGKEKAVQDLAGYVNRTATFLSTANPNLPFDAVHSVVSTHVGLLKDTIDQYFAGNYTASYTQQHAMDVQIGTGVADTVAGAIVKQFPEKF